MHKIPLIYKAPCMPVYKSCLIPLRDTACHIDGDKQILPFFGGIGAGGGIASGSIVTAPFCRFAPEAEKAVLSRREERAADYLFSILASILASSRLNTVSSVN